MIRLMTCTCQHSGQDTMYGKGVRVFNKAGTKGYDTVSDYKCTVCNSVKRR